MSRTARYGPGRRPPRRRARLAGDRPATAGSLARLVGALVVALLACACGGEATRAGPKNPGTVDTATPGKLPPVKPEAVAQFEAGMRALRLAGKNLTPDALAKARQRLARAVELDGKLWEAWYNLGVVTHMEGDDDGAIAAYGKAIAINPTYTEALLARAEAHRRAERTKEARSDYEAAIERSPDDSSVKRDATARLASLLREAKQYDDAIEVIRATLRTAGANAKVYVELGMVYMIQGRDELAELIFAKAVEIDAKEPAIYNAVALLALSRGRSQEAFNQFDRATELDPDYLDARFNKASVLIDAGDFARAKAELTQVVERSADDLSARVALGVACRGLGEHKQARSHWEAVVKRAPRRSQIRGDALFNLAVLQMSFLESEKGAAAALDRYLQEAPRNHRKRKIAEEKKKELGL